MSLQYTSGIRRRLIKKPKDENGEHSAGKKDSHYNCSQSLKKGFDEPAGLHFKKDRRKEDEDDKSGKDKGHCRKEGSQDSPEPISDVSHQPDHGGAWNQLTEGASLKKFLLSYPTVI